jgi:hypothetical protein
MFVTSLGNKVIQTLGQWEVVCVQELEIFICCCVNNLKVFERYQYLKTKLAELKQMTKLLKRLCRPIHIFTLANK